MKNKKFEIPSESMADFAEALAECQLENEICGKDDDENIIVKVYYEPEEREQMLELMEWVEENIDGEEDDE